jgi:hypothetical protein
MAKTDIQRKQPCLIRRRYSCNPLIKILHTRQTNEEGFVLIFAMVIMLVLTLIGISANRNTTTELQIAGNDRTYKETFYIADGGTEVASEVLEQNLACITGFTSNPLDGLVQVEAGRLNFWRNSWDYWHDKVEGDDGAEGSTVDRNNRGDLTIDEYYRLFYPSDSYRDMYFPTGYTAGAPHTNMVAEGVTKLTTGSAIQMAAGYEGKGRGLSAGGANLFYDIKSQHIGKNNSESVISIGYRHTIGQEGDCFY